MVIDRRKVIIGVATFASVRPAPAPIVSAACDSGVSPSPIAAAIPNLSIAALVYALAFVSLCFVVPWILYRKQIFLKV